VYHESAAITRPRRIIGKSFSFVQKEWFSARFQGDKFEFDDAQQKALHIECRAGLSQLSNSIRRA
jgi:hypothetical protein